MSLYADYIRERENQDIVESDKGFATYIILDNKECYLRDIYVAPEHRKSGIATEMADEVVRIAKEKGCTKLIGSVAVDATNPTRNMIVFLNYGMKIHSVKGNMIFLIKDI